MSLIPHGAIESAKRHARLEFPKESCGVVVDDRYIPCTNVAADPLTEFRIAPDELGRAVADGKLVAVIHSHPGGPVFPSEADMRSQMSGDVPWGIIPLDEDRTGELVLWGDTLPIPDIVGREFLHGVRDCYNLIRDCFRLGRDRLAEQGVEGWPYDPIELEEIPRDDGWWDRGRDLYRTNFERVGFHPVPLNEARAGDVFLLAIRSSQLNHGGVILSNNLILHHLPARLSRREPAGLWARRADLILRWSGADA